MPPTLRRAGRLGNPSGGVGERGFRLRQISFAQRKMRVEFRRRFQDALFADSVVEDRRQLCIASLNIPIVANRRAGETTSNSTGDPTIWCGMPCAVSGSDIAAISRSPQAYSVS